MNLLFQVILTVNVCSSAAVQEAAKGKGTIFALELVTNGPTSTSLATIEIETGNVTFVNASTPPITEAAATGDLSAVDDKRGLFYFLGDTSSGATLVALNLSTGAKVCSNVISDIAEIQFVGLGQSLDFDTANDGLVLSGVSTTDPTKHVVYRTKSLPELASATCDIEFESLGTFGLASYIPMLHASSFDAAGQRLFVQLASNNGQDYAVGIIALDEGNATISSVDVETDSMFYGMHWDPKTATLLGVVPVGTALGLLQLDPEEAEWSTNILQSAPKDWTTLYGNEGDMSTFDPSGRKLYFMAGNLDDGTTQLAEVDVDIFNVTAVPEITGDTGLAFVNIEWSEFI